MHGADGRTGGQALMRRSGGRGRKGCGQSSGRADGRTRPTRCGQANGQKRRGWGPGGADRTQHAWMGGREDGRTGRSGAEEPRSGSQGVRWSGGRAYCQSVGRADGRKGGRADERVGLGLKGHIPRGPLHS